MRIIIVLAAFIFLVSCKKEHQESEQISAIDWDTYQLKDKVDQVIIQYQYEIRDLESLPFRVMKERNETLTFNAQGQLTSSTLYNEDGSIFEKRLFQGKNKLMEYQQYLDGKLFFKTTYTWENENNTIIVKRDAQGNILDKIVQMFRNDQMVEKKNFGAGGDQMNQKTEYTYDKNGLKIEEKKYDHTSNLKTHSKFIYNNKKQLVMEATSDSKGSYTIEIHYTYDDSGRLIGIKNFSNSSNKPDYEEIKNYDDAGLLTYSKHIDYNSNETLLEMYSYDTEKRVTETKTYINEILKTSVENRYNDEGLLTETKIISGNLTNYTIREYTIDEKGNWINQKVNQNGVFVYQVNRTITYFK